MRALVLVLVLAATGCAQILGIHDRGEGGGPSGQDAPSCQKLADDCGAGHDTSCCESPLVTGGLFYRNYDASMGNMGLDAPATLSDYRLDKYPVTVERFRAFVDAGQGIVATAPPAGAGSHAHTSGTGWDPATSDPNLGATTAALKAALLGCGTGWTETAGVHDHEPMTCVNWYLAQAFCIWDGGFLPTQAEWNYAASGGMKQRVYPWSSPASSSLIDSTYAVYSVTAIADVGSKSPAGDGFYGQSDLVGNISTWVYDWSWASPPLPCDDCVNTDEVAVGTKFYIGGAFVDVPLALKIATATNGGASPEGSGGFTSLRCARPAE